jgi:GNAT superfamily N-acetyltransferase
MSGSSGRFAGQNRRRDTAATWVIADPAGRVVAYASLAMMAIDRSAAPDLLAEHASDPIHALLLGRLAVDRRCAGAGIGAVLVAHVLATAVDLNARAACRAVVVAATSASARSWWVRLGFGPLDPQDPRSSDLYMLTKDIEATLRSTS